jgi:hypothetical protein
MDFFSELDALLERTPKWTCTTTPMMCESNERGECFRHTTAALTRYANQQWSYQQAISELLELARIDKQQRVANHQGGIAWNWLSYALRPASAYATTRWYQLEAYRWSQPFTPKED